MAELTVREGEDLISQAEHARRCGVSRVAVTKWKAAGKLVLVGDLVDFAQSYKGENWHDGVKKSRQEPAAAAPAPKPAKTRKAQAEPPKTVLPPAPPADAPQVGPAGSTALKEAVTRKEEFAGRLRELEFRKLSGELVSLDLARRVLFDEARNARNAWLSFPENYSALMAADLGIDASALLEVLLKYVHKQLTAIGEPRDDFAAA